MQEGTGSAKPQLDIIIRLVLDNSCIVVLCTSLACYKTWQSAISRMQSDGVLDIIGTLSEQLGKWLDCGTRHFSLEIA